MSYAKDRAARVRNELTMVRCEVWSMMDGCADDREMLLEEIIDKLYDASDAVREAYHMLEKLEVHDFLDDDEKMTDFHLMSKEAFLASYSYLTEEEYDLTVEHEKELYK